MRVTVAYELDGEKISGEKATISVNNSCVQCTNYIDESTAETFLLSQPFLLCCLYITECQNKSFTMCYLITNNSKLHMSSLSTLIHFRTRCKKISM